ncbi:MAG: MlaD family protein [Luteibacter sp.]|uniref:PqiB family protein n=1 Tax=Luteibacter TaxID=242605 RepID=UPI00056D8FC4|nr:MULTISPECIES: MlaD family protein [unclassified Luteibacter]MDQ7998176.1 MlaD family protein [Luteibacter sp.]SKB41625.1 paraquat-inducible protein B [Luteibacter sp. 22Crub2.1]
MSDTHEGNTPSPDELPQPEVRKSKLGFSLIWLVPIVAALVGISLLVSHALSAGPQITVTFLTAEGIEAGKTQVKYKNVVIGKVTTMRLSKDRTHISVVIDLEKDAKAFATKGTRYWVVRPRIGASGVSGIDTLLSGAFIGADAGDSEEDQADFTGLETPPAVTHGAPGRRFVLHSSDLGSLDIGSPVYYRRIQVGRIVSYELDKDGKGVSLQLFIDGPNDRFVSKDARFWNASGVDVSLGADGLKLNTQSIATVIAGGVAFQSAPGPHDETPADEMAEFTLFNDQQTALAPPDGKPLYIRMTFQHSLRGLAPDAPVEFLGVKVGRVVSVNLDYDPVNKTFPVVVGALVYPQRLGKADEKLRAAVGGNEEQQMPRILHGMVDHGLRAQARTGNLLTGQLYIAIDFDKKAPKVAFNESTKPLEVPTMAGDFDHLQEQISSIVDKVEKIPFDSIGKNLDGSLQELHGTLKQVNGELLPEAKKTLQGVNKTVGTANDALSEDSPLQQNIANTLEELQRTVRSVGALTDYLGRHPEALLRGRGADAPPKVILPSTPKQGKDVQP